MQYFRALSAGHVTMPFKVKAFKNSQGTNSNLRIKFRAIQK